MHILPKITLALALCTCLITPAFAANDLISQLDKLASSGLSDAEPEDFAALKESIDADPEQALTLLKQKIRTTAKIPEQTLALYVWAMGITRSPAAINDILTLAESHSSEQVQQSAIQALTFIGGDTAGEHLLDKAKATDDPMLRYALFDAMAKMHYQPAIPHTASILNQEIDQAYWQLIFVYGKYGDDAIPFLLQQLGSNDKNTRVGTTMMLGQWLICPDAVPQFKAMYANEKNPEVRLGILSALESANPDYEDILTFFREVEKKDQDPEIRKYVRETIDNEKPMREALVEFKNSKKENRSEFEKEYATLLASYGSDGDYEKLSRFSTVADEKKLKELKAVILQRNSDECFYDYQEINKIIQFNRMLASASGI